MDPIHAALRRDMEDVDMDFDDHERHFSTSDDDPSFVDTEFSSRNNNGKEIIEPRRQVLDIEWSDEEDDFDDTNFEEEFRLHTGVGSRSKGKGRAEAIPRLDPQVEQLISHASAAYSKQEYRLAIDLCEEAIKMDGQAKQALVLLAVIYEELNDPEKALIAKILVMHLDKRNKDGWVEVAQLSREAGQFGQALVFYTRAAKLDEQDWEIRFERAMVFNEAGQPGRALENLRRLRRNYFHIIADEDVKKSIILETAQIMDSTGRRIEAINMYEDIFAKNQSQDEDGSSADVQFHWLELNILSELYYKEREYQRAIRAIKTKARWILGRGEEVWWDAIKDDSEYDAARRPAVPKFRTSAFKDDPDRYQLPIDIRARLIYCRLKEGDFKEARIHILYLKMLDINELHDLYYSVGEALEEAGLWTDALEIFEQLESVFHDAPPLLTHIAKCHTLVSQYSDGPSENINRAEEYYERAINIGANDESYLESHIESMIGLAEIYGATNRTEEAKDLVHRVYELRKYSKERSRLLQEGATQNERAHLALIPNPELKKRPLNRRLTKEEKAEAEKKAVRTAEEQYLKLQRYQDGVDKGNPISISEWINAASVLVDMFCSTKRFFPANKGKIFGGLKVNRANKKKISGEDNLDERLAFLDTQIQENELAESDDDSHDETSVSNQFRSISFDDWFTIFVQYALLVAPDDPELAYLVLRSARNVSVLHTDSEAQDEILSLVHVSCAVISKDFASSSEVVRQYINSHQFSNDAYRLYGAVLSSGNIASDIYNSNNNQKFFLRHLKAIDSLVSGKQVSGAARIVDSNFTMDQENPLFLTLYSHIMLLGRSYVLSLHYLLRAHALAPKDSMILMTLGIVYIHRAMQRLTVNRHYQILEGFSFLIDYYQIRKSHGHGEAQEAAYNLGRAFHMLGLNTLATVYYEEVLRIDGVDAVHDLRKEAAYNLSLIYTISGNGRLARAIVDEYLEI